MACLALGPEFREKCFKHLPTKIESLTKWSNELIKHEALKYSYRTGFKKGSPAAYVAAVKKGKVFLDKCCKHMKSTLEVTTFWTKELVKKEALKYNQKRKFKLGSPEAYTKSLKFGKTFHEKNCRHMVIKRIQRTDEEIKTQLLKYKSFSEARLKNTKLMETAAYRGKKFYKEATKHMESKVIQQEKIYIIKVLIPKIKKALKQTNQKFHIKTDIFFKHKNKNIFIDVIVSFPELNKTIPMEIKHNSRSWKLTKIQKQIETYNDYFEKVNKEKVFLVSPNGKYGINDDEFVKILLSFIKTGKLKKPNYKFV